MRGRNTHDGATIAEYFCTRRATPEFDEAILRTGRPLGPTGFLIIDIRNRKLDDDFTTAGRISDSDAGLWRVGSILLQHPAQLTLRIEQHLETFGL